MLARVNDNAYKIDLAGEYNVSTTFNVSNLSLFDVGDDSWTNLSKEGGSDGDHQARIQGLVERMLSNDCFEKNKLVVEPKWLTLTIIKGLS